MTVYYPGYSPVESAAFSVVGRGALIPSNPVLWYDTSDASTITKAYQSLTPTVTGTSGSTSLVASSDLSGLIFAGASIKVNSADIYIVASISTSAGVSTITTSTSLVNSYAANALATFKVSQINDKSGNGFNATQGTASAQPIYSPQLINNKPCLVYADAQNLNFANIPGMEVGFTVFIAIQSNQDVSAHTFGNAFVINGTVADVAQRQPLLYFHKSNTRYNISIGTYDAMQFNPSNNIPVQCLMTYDGATTATSKVTGLTLQSHAVTQLTASVSTGGLGTPNMYGFIGEVIAYKRLLSTTEVIQVQTYLANKWGAAV